MRPGDRAVLDSCPVEVVGVVEFPEHTEVEQMGAVEYSRLTVGEHKLELVVIRGRNAFHSWIHDVTLRDRSCMDADH